MKTGSQGTPIQIIGSRKFMPSIRVDKSELRLFFADPATSSFFFAQRMLRHSKMVSVENKTLKGGGFDLKQMIWDTTRDSIQEWTGMRLAEVSLYGIRVYETGAVLAPHVDRLPLVSSAIINVDQDVDEPW